MAAALQERLSAPSQGAASDARGPAVWDNVREFYRQRQGLPAWVTHLSPAKNAAAAVEILRTAPLHGLVVADYGSAAIAEQLKRLEHSAKSAADRREQLADFDVRLTTALLTLGHDVALGHGSPDGLAPSWQARRTSPDLAGTLSKHADANMAAWLDSIRPTHPEYAALEAALAHLRDTAKAGGWPVVAKATFTAGHSSPAVTTLRKRLGADGSAPAGVAASTSTTYDADLATSVHTFQEHNGMRATGIADAATIAAMNVSVDRRISQVETNLERWRWMPDDFGARYLLVNIPQFQVAMREDGKTVNSIRVVVGKLEHETPIFSSEMSTIVFSPYWNIPDSIVTGETAPAAARDPRYLAKHRIEILRVTTAGTSTVKPSQVSWNDAKELRQLAFRQMPGPENALGHVKFLFPNKYDVYLHDSPADELFARPGRALSHGCVRVEEPETLAQYVMRGDADWPLDKILTAMNSGVEKHVKLKQPLPVHIVYFTAFVDPNGGLHYLKDVYGYDAKQLVAAHTLSNVTRHN